MGVCTSTPLERIQPSNMKPLPIISNSSTAQQQPHTNYDISQRLTIETLSILHPPKKLFPCSTTSTSSDSYSQSNSMINKPCKLLYSFNTHKLASLVKYILENEPLFSKYKHESENVYNAFINYKMKGKMLRKLSRVQFSEKLAWIRSVISSKIYIWLKCLSDEEVINMLSHIQLEQVDIPKQQQTNTENTINIELPAYLNQRPDNSPTITSSEYSQDIVDQLVTLGYGTEEECIEASVLCNNYRDINSVADRLENYENISKSDNCHHSQMDIQMYDEKAFQIFVYTLCVIHNYDLVVIERLLKTLIDIGMNGCEFMALKRIDFCRMFKKYNIKAAIASKLYKLVMDNHENIGTYLENNNSVSILYVDEQDKELTCDDLSQIAVGGFQDSAYAMLEIMNANMKMNIVNGLVLIEHYKSKQVLKRYLKKNVTCKSVNVLVDLMWNDYMRDNDKINRKVIGYNRKQLLKYFIALYMYHVKEIMIKYNLNENKCLLLKRKGVCQIFINECGFSIGVATNIVDKIYHRIV